MCSYSQINEDLILMQIVLTKIMNVLNNLKAANATLYQAASINKQISPAELQNFWLLMEVYGSILPMSVFEPVIVSL